MFKMIVVGAVVALTSANAKAQNSCELPKAKTTAPCKAVAPKPIVKPVAIVPPATPCCDKDKGKVETEASAQAQTGSIQSKTGEQNAKTGNQSVIINMPVQPTTRIIVKERTRIKREIRTVEVFKPNRVQLFLGLSKTKLEVQGDDCNCKFSAKKVYEPDFGAQYLRDFGGFTGSVAATVHENLYLGLGFNW